MARNFWIWASIALVFVGLPKFTYGQLDLEMLKDRPRRMYEQYGANPYEDAIKGLPKILSKDLSDSERDERNDDTVPSVLGLYLPYNDTSIVDNINCTQDVSAMLRVFEEKGLLGQVLANGNLWPLIITDSWGKPGDGILNGNSLIWGLMEECINMQVWENRTFKFPLRDPLDMDFRGHYCLGHIKKSNSTTYTAPVGISLEEKVLLDIDTSPDFYYYGTCMPSSCTQQDMRVSLEYLLQNSSELEVVDIQCQTEDGIGGENNAGDVAFEVIIGTIWVLIVGAAIVEFLIDLAKKPELKKGPLKYWLAVSSYRSMSKIFKIVNKTNPDVIDCLHGLRALSMIWVTWCHSYSLFVKLTQNLKGLEVISSNAMAQIIFNGSFSADTFFFISGLLAAYSVLREHEVNGKVNWIMFYLHRIIRLVPAIALTCFFMATVAKYALVGPYGPYIDKDFLQPCREYWYMDVLFISNFPNEGYKCLPQSWYTAVDTQLYFILPLVLVPLILKRNIGLGVLCLFTGASFIVPTSIFAIYNLKPYLPFAVPEIDPEDLTLNNDHMPWSRASPYFIGVWAGWLLFTFKNKKVKLPWLAVVIGWCVSITISLLVLLGMAPYNTAADPTTLPSGISTFYGGFSRGAWALSLVWVVFACQKGFSGPVNSFLGHACWLPLSRLAFSMFLITVPVQLLSAGSTFLPSYMNHLTKFIDSCGYLFVSGLIAMGIGMTCEVPILALEKLIFPRPGRNVQEEPPKES